MGRLLFFRKEDDFLRISPLAQLRRVHDGLPAADGYGLRALVNSVHGDIVRAMRKVWDAYASEIHEWGKHLRARFQQEYPEAGVYGGRR